MFLNITDKAEAENKGSSARLVHYLDKENRLDQPVEQWFSHELQTFESYQVRHLIDANIAKLGRQDAKFFLLNISPSQKEISHLKSLFGEQGAKHELKRFAQKIMDEYARNFKREGIQSSKDLLWFAKLEQHRYYSHKDREVKNGQAKRGAQKPGEQMHIQVIISRKDITNKIKLSPNNNSRGTNQAHSRKVGQFDRVAFKASGERVFDETFNFIRPLPESFKYANIQAKGSLAERIAMAAELVRGSGSETIRQQNFKQHLEGQVEDRFRANDHVSLLDIVLAKAEYDPQMLPGKKHKRKKKKVQGQGRNF
jgi:hypothetical protein